MSGASNGQNGGAASNNGDAAGAASHRSNTNISVGQIVIQILSNPATLKESLLLPVLLDYFTNSVGQVLLSQEELAQQIMSNERKLANELDA